MNINVETKFNMDQSVTVVVLGVKGVEGIIKQIRVKHNASGTSILYDIHIPVIKDYITDIPEAILEGWKKLTFCEKCGVEIKPGDKFYTAVGVIQCEECNTKSGGTVSMDFIFNKIERQSKK